MRGIRKALVIGTLSVAISVAANWKGLKEYFKPEYIQKPAHRDHPAGTSAAFSFGGRLNDPTGAVVSELYGVNEKGPRPVTMIIDREGTIRWVKIGATTFDELERNVRPFL